MSPRRTLIPIGLALFMVAFGGCVADQPTRPTPRAPSDVRAHTITIASHTLLDEDGNGYPDTIPLIVYMWDLPSRYPLPVWDEGTMRFELHDEHDRLLAEWDVPPEVVVASRRRDQVGAVHMLTLDIRDAMADALPATKAMLSARFLSTDGYEASTARPLAIKIGA